MKAPDKPPKQTAGAVLGYGRVSREGLSGRKAATQMARMFGVSPPTVSRIVAAYVAGAGDADGVRAVSRFREVTALSPLGHMR